MVRVKKCRRGGVGLGKENIVVRRWGLRSTVELLHFPLSLERGRVQKFWAP